MQIRLATKIAPTLPLAFPIGDGDNQQIVEENVRDERPLASVVGYRKGPPQRLLTAHDRSLGSIHRTRATARRAIRRTTVRGPITATVCLSPDPPENCPFLAAAADELAVN